MREDRLAKKSITDDSRTLRADAEARFARTSQASATPEASSPLLHELQIHQIELEMQNEELRRDQLEVEEANRRFVDLYDYAPVGYLTISDTGKIVEANLTCANLLREWRGKLLGRQFAAFLVPEDADRWYLLISTLRQSDGEPMFSEMKVRRQDGSVFHGHLALVRRGTDGEPSHIRITLTDVSALKQSEQESRLNAQKLQAVLDAVPAAVFITHDRDSAHIETNRFGAEMMMVPTSANVPKTGPRGSDLPASVKVLRNGVEVPPEHLPVQMAAKQGIDILNCAMDVVGNDGSIKHVFGNAIPLLNEGGQPAGAVGAYLDVTEQVEQARQLREVKERLSYVLDGSNDGFWDWDVPSGHVKFSRRWAQMFGYDLDELEPSIATCEQMSNAEDHAKAEQTIQACLQGKTSHFESVERIRHKDGRWVWAHIRGKVVERNADGEPVRVTGTFTDFDERRRVEDDLRASRDENVKLVTALQEALRNVKTLSGLLPICMYCKKIRDDQGYWERIEHFISSHTDALFSHGMCEECYQKHKDD
jgi:PAS domain S-box-containing protein